MSWRWLSVVGKCWVEAAMLGNWRVTFYQKPVKATWRLFGLLEKEKRKLYVGDLQSTP